LATGRTTSLRNSSTGLNKQIQEATKEEPFPIVIAADRRNYDRYQKVADKDAVIAHLEGSFETARAHDIIRVGMAISTQGELSSRNEAKDSKSCVRRSASTNSRVT
jgi:hypothetical protein